MKVTFINKIEFTLLDNIFNSQILSTDSIRLPFEAVWDELCIVGLAELKISQAIENKQRTSTATLTLRTADVFDTGNKKLVFLVTDIDGKKHLLGAPDLPCPIVTNEENHGTSPSETYNRVVITYKNTHIYRAV